MKLTFVSTKKPIFLVGVALVFTSLTAWSAVSLKDINISDHVGNELRFDPAVPFNTIDVSTNQGVVTLTGSVTSLLSKERATRLTQTVRGVRSVINQIDVNPLADRSGHTLQAAVEESLHYDAATDSYEINVDADEKGQVTLKGTVDSWAEKNLAEMIAKGVSGVVSVSNKINIKPKTNRPDTEIKPEIEKRLYWNALVDDGLIDVSVVDSKVTLSGVVGSAAEKRQAELDAWVNGVSVVDASDLKVEKWAREKDLRDKKYVPRSDLEIRQAVHDTLLYDPRVNSFDIDVGVLKGYVTLRGVVDNIQAKKAAVSDARNTVGVVRVNNLIKVRSEAKMADKDIAANVRSALLRNPFTESHELNVRVTNGVVQLSGTVDTYYEKGIAENVAQHALGASSVRNYIGVNEPDVITYNPYVYDWSIYNFSWYDGNTMTPSKSDWEIRMDIEDELLWSPFVDVNDVDVTVQAGVVTLTGIVDSWMEYNAAWENALQGGAISVINNLTIQ